MRKFDNYPRVKRLIESAISDFALDLKGMSVLTEAASGVFVVTPLIAALSGADKVIAVTKDSYFGLASEIKEYTENWAKNFGVADRIKVSCQPSYMHAQSVDLVTNLGFVRPIDKIFIDRLPVSSAISLMWETWEFRKEDIDLETCRKRRIPVLGTNEKDHRLNIFRYVGLLAVKLLFEAGVEVFKSNVLLIGSGHFGKETKKVLQLNGCNPVHIDPCENWLEKIKGLKHIIKSLDAIVLVEHKVRFPLLGGDTGILLDWLVGTGIRVIHVCGNIDYKGLEELNIKKYPPRKVDFGYMTVTTDYVGPRPVIDLHTAGLKVGEALVKGMRKYRAPEKAIKYALENSPAMDFV